MQHPVRDAAHHIDGIAFENRERHSQTCRHLSLVAAGYAGDMPEELANELLDDMDFDRYGKVKCRAIEQLMPKLMKMVESEMEGMRNVNDGYTELS